MSKTTLKKMMQIDVTALNIRRVTTNNKTERTLRSADHDALDRLVCYNVSTDSSLFTKLAGIHPDGSKTTAAGLMQLWHLPEMKWTKEARYRLLEDSQEAPEKVVAEISGLCANRAKLEAEVGDQTSTGPGQNQCTWEPEEKIVSPAEISGPCGDLARLEAEAGDQTSTESGHVGAREEGCDQRRPADFVWIERQRSRIGASRGGQWKRWKQEESPGGNSRRRRDAVEPSSAVWTLSGD
ncbi:hypothetical protein Bbelb_051000 [Branchiostoma belcheri]|nr:hypothetical protein Bbelb_051000 [Branchiostoma belcheri]